MQEVLANRERWAYTVRQRRGALDRSAPRLKKERSERTVRVADHQMVGKIGRVTGTVGSGRVGEVMVPVRGGTEHFHAYAADADDLLRPGTSIVIVEYRPPRSVVVTEL
jgi:membrane protein implicated in regulation of membrane protease activity